MSLTRRVGFIFIVAGLLLSVFSVIVDIVGPAAPLDTVQFGPLQILALAVGLLVLAIGILFTLELLDLTKTASSLLSPPGWLAIVAAVLVLVLLGALLFSSTGRDDSYISYWPAHTLATYGEMVNYNGARVEQSSSLLLVLLMAGFSKLTGATVPIVGPILSIVGGAACVVLVYVLSRRLHPLSAFAAALLTALCAYVVYWSFSGSEGPLVAVAALALILAGARYLTDESVTWQSTVLVGTAMLAFILVRPETPVALVGILVALLIVILIRREGTLRRASGLLGLGIGIILAVVAFRLLYFGAPFPQPVGIKVGGSPLEMIRRGILYVQKEFWRNTPLKLLTVAIVLALAYAVVKIFRTKKIDYMLTLTVLFAAVYTLFPMMVGGDWMEGARFYVPVLPALFVLLAFAVADVITSRPALAGSFLVLLAIQAFAFKAFVENWSVGMPAWVGVDHYEDYARSYGEDFNWFDKTNRDHLRDVATIPHLEAIVDQLSVQGVDPVVIYTTQAGMAPYHLMEERFQQGVEVYDFLGLANREFVDCLDQAGMGDQRGKVSMSLYFTEQDLFDACGIPQPDVVFYPIFNTESLDEIREGGFSVAYEQYGNIIYDSTFFPGIPLEIDQFIAVREELMPILSDKYPMTVDITDLMSAPRTATLSP